jgi:hypothetical protein
MTAAVALGIVAQIAALGETWDSGRPIAGHWAYVSTLAALASAISILNARRPGSGVWALLMGVLVLVFLLPWLEGRGLLRVPEGWEKLQLRPPWNLFFGLLVITGVTNYLPTRFWPAAIAAAASFVMIYLGLAGTTRPLAIRGLAWSAAPWCLAVGIALADIRAGAHQRACRNDLERLWLWFRDHWGVVWALRVQERFNRNALISGWSIRLSWQGVAAVDDGDFAVSERQMAAGEATLKMLLRRFADEARLERVMRG